ncbi:hypothetical protein, partial [Paraburkholderia sp.]|uniref:hypothetical protein n=1 Tax=Paraburkholderia sp. TaxID=1926495 RepID=UPI002AFEE48F
MASASSISVPVSTSIQVWATYSQSATRTRVAQSGDFIMSSANSSSEAVDVQAFIDQQRFSPY